MPCLLNRLEWTNLTPPFPEHYKQERFRQRSDSLPFPPDFGTPAQRQAFKALPAVSEWSDFDNCHRVIRVYDAAGTVIEMYEHKGDFKEVQPSFLSC
jgi:hypothetical protein